MGQVESFLAIVVSAIAILGAIGGLIYWKSQVDSFVKACTNLPDRVKSLEDKMDIVWSLCVDDILKGKPLLAERGSGYKLTPEGEACLSALDLVIKQIIQENKNIPPSDALLLVTRKIGREEFQRIVHESGCSLSEFYSLLTIKLGANI